MSVAHQQGPGATPLTPEAYLEAEQTSPVKHEYVRGELFAMSGARKAHATLALNLAAGLRAHLRGGPCRAYMSDVKVFAEEAESFFYPDVVIACDPRDRADPYVIRHPKVVIEVLSPTTEARDRGGKLFAYLALESLEEYLLVAQSNRRIERFRRASDGTWSYTILRAGDALELASLGFKGTVDEIYDGVELEEVESSVA